MPCAITLPLSKGKGQTLGKTKANACASLWGDAEVAVEPQEQGQLLPGQELSSVTAWLRLARPQATLPPFSALEGSVFSWN